MAAILDCRSVAQKYNDWVVAAKANLDFTPCLSTVLFRPSQNPSSLQYRDLILKDAQRLGLKTKSLEVSEEGELLKTIARLNDDDEITGVVVFYPLKTSLRDEDVMDMVSPRKDVEGLHSTNLGYLIKYRLFLNEEHGIKCVVPATAKAVVKIFQSYPEIRPEGAYVVIVNNSMRVGKPLGLMLENLGATVTKCYDKTPAPVLEDCVRRADILITAVPDAKFKLNSAWVKKSAVVIDVSYQGNIDAPSLKNHASFITSPDNRVGQVTRAMMFVNLIYCARQLRLHEPSGR